MTQRATPESVLAPFDEVRLESRGRTYQLKRDGDAFWVTMADPDWEIEKHLRGFDLAEIKKPPLVERRVVMTTGSHHYQGYWIPGRFGNELRQFTFVFHI